MEVEALRTSLLRVQVAFDADNSYQSEFCLFTTLNVYDGPEGDGKEEEGGDLC